MNTIERFDIHHHVDGVSQVVEGDWVRYSDHAAEVERLKTEKRELHMAVIFGAMVAADDTQELKEVIEVLAVQKAERDTLTAENAALKSANSKQAQSDSEQIWSRTCIHHTDAERAQIRCPVCLMRENAALKEEVEKTVTGLAGIIDHLKADLTAARARIAELEEVLRAMLASHPMHSLSDDTLLETARRGPNEDIRIKARLIGKARQALTRTSEEGKGYWGIVGKYTGEVIGVCTNQADVLAEEPGSTFFAITKEQFEAFGDDPSVVKNPSQP